MLERSRPLMRRGVSTWDSEGLCIRKPSFLSAVHVSTNVSSSAIIPSHLITRSVHQSAHDIACGASVAGLGIPGLDVLHLRVAGSHRGSLERRGRRLAAGGPGLVAAMMVAAAKVEGIAWR